MLRNWKLLEVAAILVVLTSSGILWAGGQDTNKAASDRLESTLKDITAKLEKMDKGVADAFSTMSKDMSELKSDITPLKGLALKIEDIDKSLGKLKMEMADLKNKLKNGEGALAPTQTRTSLSPAGSGRVSIVNMYPDRLMFRLNGQDYPVEPQRSLMVDLPPGSFTYRVFSPVWGWLEPHSRVLTPGETFTLTASLP